MPSIYALRNRTSDDVYYGSTKSPLSVRLHGHKYSKRYMTSREIVACPTAYIEPVEEVSVEQMKERENWWIRNNPCVNKARPILTREERLEYQKNYYQEHQAVLKAQMRKRNETPEGKEKAKERHARWIAIPENREKVLAKQRERRAKQSSS